MSHLVAGRPPPSAGSSPWIHPPHPEQTSSLAMQHTHATSSALPASWQECQERGWHELDILLVSGDAYVDHPSFGIALIGRLLESHGYRVAILAQPRHTSLDDFLHFPPPRLFCGVSAGNLDSIVANYSGNGKVRDHDAYSPGGNPWYGDTQERAQRRRPDRASMVYANAARAAFPGVPIILGGIEASLRRFIHYDYKQENLRASILTDAKADLLVYGMGERAVVEIAARCQRGQPLTGIPGTCIRLTDRELASLCPQFEGKSTRALLLLPSWEDIEARRDLFLDAERQIDDHSRAASSRLVLQRQQHHWLLQYPSQPPLTSAELDALYDLPFTRRPHPATADIPAYRMIRDSVTIVRGCSGNCSFCAITRHQGAAVVSRGRASIIAECRRLAAMDDFSGTISDLGGPTANLYGTSCAIGTCKKHQCLYPQLCPNLQTDEGAMLSLLEEAAAVEGVRHVFISSGLRMELLLKTPRLLETILDRHTPGALKIAPEHSDATILALMNKEPHALLERFVAACRRIARKLGRNIELTPYLLLSHPGSRPESVERLVADLRRLNLSPRTFQDFTPTPGTLSTAMYVTGRDPRTSKSIPVPRNRSERMRERKILEACLNHHGGTPRKPGKGRRQ